MIWRCHIFIMQIGLARRLTRRRSCGKLHIYCKAFLLNAVHKTKILSRGIGVLSAGKCF